MSLYKISRIYLQCITECIKYTFDQRIFVLARYYKLATVYSKNFVEFVENWLESVAHFIKTFSKCKEKKIDSYWLGQRFSNCVPQYP